MPIPPRIKGWCPSIAQPMLAGDGFLMRINIEKPLTPAIFSRIGELAKSYGSGLIDLTRRGNLQIRGVTEQNISTLQQELSTLGLDESVSRKPHIIGMPLLGLDEAAPQKLHSLIADLESALFELASQLPPKFCLLVDDSGVIPLDDIPADIRLISTLDGCLVAIGNVGHIVALARLPVAQTAAAVLSLVRVFAQHSPFHDARRMSDLIKAIGTDKIASLVGLQQTPHMLASRPFKLRQVIGQHELFFGAAAPYGRLNSAQVEAIASAAHGEIRVTPWRSLLLPPSLENASTAFESADLIVNPDDPRLKIIACPGKNFCASGEIDTHRLGSFFAAALKKAKEQNPLIHISGCKKGCAHSNPAALTFVGESGAINAVRNGRTDDRPDQENLTEQQAELLVRELFLTSQYAKVDA